MKEKKILLDEIDAGGVYAAVCHMIKTRTWDVSDECDWSMLVHLKDLKERFETYLDEGTGRGVVEV